MMVRGKGNDTNPETIDAIFADRRMYNEDGRLIFALANAFTNAGYRVRLRTSSLFERNIGSRNRRLLAGLTNFQMMDDWNAGKSSSIVLSDNRAYCDGAKGSRRTIVCSFDLFGRPWQSRTLFPYQIHPVHAASWGIEQLRELRQKEKRVRIFFSGDVDGYDSAVPNFPVWAPPRRAQLDTIASRFESIITWIYSDDRCALVFEGKVACDGIAMARPGHFWMEQERWLPYLAACDFFLCLPGIAMPIAHNCIEAMSVGAIPILSYRHWFSPPLEPGVNCITYQSLDDLPQAIETALNMRKEARGQMAGNVCRYYDHYLAPDKVASRILQSGRRTTRIVLMSSRYVCSHAEHLNSHSWLISGPRFKRWFLGV